MKISLYDDHEAMSRAAAALIVREIARQSENLLCLATGSTPTRTYASMAARARRSPAAFARLRVLKLDEWGGLPENDPGSCETYLREHVIQPWGISPRRFTGFSAVSDRPESECDRIRQWLVRNGPIDLCVLGLGRNGHLGFNEPGPLLHPVAHRATLTAETLAHPMLERSATKPTFGLTLGLAEILQSRRILLLVSGAHKQAAFQRLVRNEISTDFPASLLALHPQTTVLCDRAAAALEPSGKPATQP